MARVSEGLGVKCHAEISYGGECSRPAKKLTCVFEEGHEPPHSYGAYYDVANKCKEHPKGCWDNQ